MQFTRCPEPQAVATIERAVELGVNHLETARGYGNSEERVGKALKNILKKVLLLKMLRAFATHQNMPARTVHAINNA